MLKELRLRNWKSFADATLYIDPLTILIGSNASGKSNALDALLFLSRVSRGVSLFSAIAGDLNLPALRGGIEWVCRKPEKRFSLTLVVSGEQGREEYRYHLGIQVNATKAEVQEEELIWLQYGPRSQTAKEKSLLQTRIDEANSPAIPTYYHTGTKGWGKRADLARTQLILTQTETIHNANREVQRGAQQVLRQLQGIFVFDPIPSHMRDYSPLADKLSTDGSNIAGVLAGLDAERKLAVEAALTQYLKALPERDIKRIWTELVGKFGTDAMLYCEEGWDGQPTHEVDARGMSDGTLRYVAIVTALLTREPGSLLVIEEVDNGLHPSRAHLLVSMLQTLGKERGIDVLVTTHNPALLDAAGLAMVPFITVAHRDDATGFSGLTPLEEIEQLPKLIAGGSLGTLSSKGRIEAALKQDHGQ
ncbi:AAA family ATPase [Lamprobacter modestohalophilus]|uniref:AAA family ATPase n=1 Tax=Lamprobacter modestohalophilus TaxID=1064514 RepID=UPI002ADEA769|nr:AAA family ATPase [Lamprobacter modestohalophilus]MEA1052953.1 AAA family ATPase [Lamprobacter modestohalophilus]